jgi:hypothetical protein
LLDVLLKLIPLGFFLGKGSGSVVFVRWVELHPSLDVPNNIITTVALYPQMLRVNFSFIYHDSFKPDR